MAVLRRESVGQTIVFRRLPPRQPQTRRIAAFLYRASPADQIGLLFAVLAVTAVARGSV
jgi:hypothetical protein